MEDFEAKLYEVVQGCRRSGPTFDGRLSEFECSLDFHCEYTAGIGRIGLVPIAPVSQRRPLEVDVPA